MHKQINQINFKVSMSLANNILFDNVSQSDLGLFGFLAWLINKGIVNGREAALAEKQRQHEIDQKKIVKEKMDTLNNIYIFVNLLIFIIYTIFFLKNWEFGKYIGDCVPTLFQKISNLFLNLKAVSTIKNDVHVFLVSAIYLTTVIGHIIISIILKIMLIFVGEHIILYFINEYKVENIFSFIRR